MPEEIAGTATETAPVVVVVATADVGREQRQAEAQVERFTVAATFAPASANEDDRMIDAVWYTGAKIPRFDWRTGEEYDLILDMKGCRFDRLNTGGPVLDSHSAYGVGSQLGVVRKAWAAKSTGVATLQFSKRDAVTPVWNDVRAGIIQNLSPGMWIYSKRETTPDGQQRKEFTATDWEPFEISLVPVPADANTTFMSAAGTLPPAQPSVVEPQRASAQPKETPDMEPTTQDAGETARQNEVALAAARDEAVKAERLRASQIRTMAVPFRLDEKFVTAIIDEGVTLETARERIMTKLVAQYEANPVNPTNPSVTMVADATDKRREGMEAAILFRGNPGNSNLRDAGREYAGLTLVNHPH